jgi:hypothetical protein
MASTYLVLQDRVARLHLLYPRRQGLALPRRRFKSPHLSQEPRVVRPQPLNLFAVNWNTKGKESSEDQERSSLMRIWQEYLLCGSDASLWSCYATVVNVHSVMVLVPCICVKKRTCSVQVLLPVPVLSQLFIVCRTAKTC